MRSISHLLIIACMLVLNSCSKDENAPANSLSFGGERYKINDAHIHYTGIIDVVNRSAETPTHYSYSMAISDGMDNSSGFYSLTDNGTYMLTITFAIPITSNSSNFSGGTFDCPFPPPWSGGKAFPVTENFANDLRIVIDTDGDKSLITFTERLIHGTTGRVSIISKQGVVGGDTDEFDLTINSDAVEDPDTDLKITGNFRGIFKMYR
jgi:hypothetical protein